MGSVQINQALLAEKKLQRARAEARRARGNSRVDQASFLTAHMRDAEAQPAPQ